MASMQNMMMEMMEMRLMGSMMDRMSEKSSSDDGCSGHSHGCSGAHTIDDNELEEYMKDNYGDMKNIDMDAFNEKYDELEQEYDYMMNEFNEYYDEHRMNAGN